MQFCVAVSHRLVTSVEVFTLSLDLVSTILFHLDTCIHDIYTLVSNGAEYHIKPLNVLVSFFVNLSYKDYQTSVNISIIDPGMTCKYYCRLQVGAEVTERKAIM